MPAHHRQATAAGELSRHRVSQTCGIYHLQWSLLEHHHGAVRHCRSLFGEESSRCSRGMHAHEAHAMMGGSKLLESSGCSICTVHQLTTSTHAHTHTHQALHTARCRDAIKRNAMHPLQQGQCMHAAERKEQCTKHIRKLSTQHNTRNKGSARPVLNTQRCATHTTRHRPHSVQFSCLLWLVVCTASRPRMYMSVNRTASPSAINLPTTAGGMIPRAAVCTSKQPSQGILYMRSVTLLLPQAFTPSPSTAPPY